MALDLYQRPKRLTYDTPPFVMARLDRATGSARKADSCRPRSPIESGMTRGERVNLSFRWYYTLGWARTNRTPPTGLWNAPMPGSRPLPGSKAICWRHGGPRKISFRSARTSTSGYTPMRSRGGSRIGNTGGFPQCRRRARGGATDGRRRISGPVVGQGTVPERRNPPGTGSGLPGRGAGGLTPPRQMTPRQPALPLAGALSFAATGLITAVMVSRSTVTLMSLAISTSISWLGTCLPFLS